MPFDSSVDCLERCVLSGDLLCQTLTAESKIENKTNTGKIEWADMSTYGQSVIVGTLLGTTVSATFLHKPMRSTKTKKPPEVFH